MVPLSPLYTHTCTNKLTVGTSYFIRILIYVILDLIKPTNPLHAHIYKQTDRGHIRFHTYVYFCDFTVDEILQSVLRTHLNKQTNRGHILFHTHNNICDFTFVQTRKSVTHTHTYTNKQTKSTYYV